MKIPEQLKEDIKILVEYCSDANELADFFEQLSVGDIEPDDKDLPTILNDLGYSCDPNDEDSIDDALYDAKLHGSDEFVLACGTGHVYPTAVRVAKALRQLEEV